MEVHDNGMTVPLLNEIEFIDGEVSASRAPLLRLEPQREAKHHAPTSAAADC